MSNVDVNKIQPTNFEDRYYDEYEYYNLTDKYTGGSSQSQRVNPEGKSDGLSWKPTMASLATERDGQTQGAS
ncbi:hypothetical protein LDENG_00241370 [Lucifuga dentata]|nr:hypothetical protein LDENG_00241370 [Lucifuga dentata]